MAYTRTPNTVIAGKALNQTPQPVPLTPSGVLPVLLNANIATTTSPGVVIVGSNINVSNTGVISVTFPESRPGCNSRLITGDYTAALDDYYIGVLLSAAATLTLPLDPPDCVEYVIKLEFGEPFGTKKLTIVASGANKIDDDTSITLTTPYQSVSLISRGNNWHII